MNLLPLLVNKGVIDEGEVTTIEKEVQSSGDTLEEVLARRGVNSSDVLTLKGEQLHVPTRSVGDTHVPFEVLKYVPEESATHYKFVPLGVADGVLEVGVVDPDNIEALDALNFISSKANLPFKVYLISEGDFAKVLQMYKGLGGEVSKALSELETELTAEEKGPLPALDEDNLTVETKGGKIKEDAPVTKIVATILQHAVKGKASDIHIEPMESLVRVRFRVDGIMQTNLTLPLKVHRAVVARIKILSTMRIDERRKPQDGRFSTGFDGRKIDFRVSTFPSYYGEKIVLRILDRDEGFIKIDDIGFSKRNLEAVRNALKRPYGLILISGPTGSGKSTTLYSMLSELDREKKNVLSLEDPVEYNIEGMSQSQVKPEIGYTFATGLRSTLRQDPDIIMVGEIRDKETAQLAVQAALTGHLVFSTVHTNNVIGVIPRLIDMGVDPYLIAPTLTLAIAQRLVRTLCPNSGKPIPVDGSLKLMIDKEFEDLPEQFRKEIQESKNFYGVEPSKECPDGTRGRTAVFEVLEMNKEIEQVILTNPVESEIKKIARQNGMFTMKESAIIKAVDRQIPFEEINTLGGQLLSAE
jgi:type IV pilus assembly protein PilB|tara:strand:+ start:32908 stop:34656 length:1749 start_codon:yes stop_codon:yes gene_type:complete